jgi:hypothetical protein
VSEIDGEILRGSRIGGFDHRGILDGVPDYSYTHLGMLGTESRDRENVSLDMTWKEYYSWDLIHLYQALPLDDSPGKNCYSQLSQRVQWFTDLQEIKNRGY